MLGKPMGLLQRRPFGGCPHGPSAWTGRPGSPWQASSSGLQGMCAAVLAQAMLRQVKFFYDCSGAEVSDQARVC